MKRRKLMLIMLLAGCCSWVTMRAQTSVMTLRQCMEYAISNSTKMRLQAADRNDERWQRRQAIMQVFTPYVDAQTYAYYQFGRNLDPETNTYNSVTTFHNGYSVSASITLFDGFRAINNMRMASTVAKMGLSRDQQMRDEICLATMEAYYNVIYYSELEKVLTEQVQTAKTARDKALRQEELGQKGHADVVQMESELAQKQYHLINTNNRKTDAMITLKDVMFWPIESELTIDTNVQEPEVTLANTEDLSQTAKSILPEAEIAQMNLRKAKLDLRMARGAYSPKLNISGGWSTTYYTYPGMAGYNARSFSEQFSNNAGEYIQFSLNIPIFDQFQRRTTLRMKKNALSRAKAEYDQTMRDIENEVARAVNDRDGAFASYQQADKLAAVQQEAFNLSRKQFEHGLISAIEYQTASQTYLNAMAERVNALLILKLKDAVVKHYKGNPYITQYE